MPKLRLPTSNPGMSIPLSGLCPSRIQALKTGEIDLIYGSAELSYEDYNQAIAIDGIDGKFAPYGSTVRNIILNFNGNLADLSVRQALAYAIDKIIRRAHFINQRLVYGSAGDQFRSFTPVSYTHLDVYKRQALETAFRSSAVPFCCPYLDHSLRSAFRRFI